MDWDDLVYLKEGKKRGSKISKGNVYVKGKGKRMTEKEVSEEDVVNRVE